MNREATENKFSEPQTKSKELEKVLERIEELKKRASGPFHPLHGEMHIDLVKLEEKEKKVKEMLANNDQ